MKKQQVQISSLHEISPRIAVMTPSQLEVDDYNCSYHRTEPDGDLNYCPYKSQGLKLHSMSHECADEGMQKSEITCTIIDVIFRKKHTMKPS